MTDLQQFETWCRAKGVDPDSLDDAALQSQMQSYVAESDAEGVAIIRETIKANAKDWTRTRRAGLLPIDIAAAVARDRGVLTPETRRLTYLAAHDRESQGRGSRAGESPAPSADEP